MRTRDTDLEWYDDHVEFHRAYLHAQSMNPTELIIMPADTPSSWWSGGGHRLRISAQGRMGTTHFCYDWHGPSERDPWFILEEEEDFNEST